MSRNINDTNGLSRLFHLNSEPWPDERAEPSEPFAQKSKSHPDAARVALPPTEPGDVDGLAAARRSVRAFCDAPMALAELAAMLRSGYGVLGPDRMPSGQQLLRRTVPSAGGLYPLEIYALVRNVEGLAKGVYHYDAIGGALEVIAQGPWEDHARAAFPTWEFVADAPVVLCIGAVFDRTQSKYGPRGYRFVLIEAGHVAQNLCLAAQERGLASLCMGGYRDSVLNHLVALDGEGEAVVYTVALGMAAQD
jgi:SagB-type dehydrogenase family enzyme